MSKAPSSIYLGNTAKIEAAKIVQVKKLNRWSMYEYICYTFDVLVPEDNETEVMVPPDHMLQKVHIGKKKRWRAIRDPAANLPKYLTAHLTPPENYSVKIMETGLFTALDPSVLLLFFTASVTPFETAFLAAADESVVKLDLLFFLNRFVDIVFFVDIFIQCRMPFRDEQTGHLILDVRKISSRYFKSWFFLDVISVLPFEFIGLILHTGSLTDLALLRFVRLTRLLKLLRVFRASRKLKRLQVSSGLRYSTLELLKIVIVTLFLIHWLGCGYRLIADLGGPNPTDLGWVHAFSIARSHISNVTLSIDEIYFASIYYSSSVLSLIGPTQDFMSPTNNREFFFTVVMNFIGYFLMLFSMSTVTQIFSLTNEVRRKQDILVDDYLALLDDLKLDKRLKFTIYEHLSDFFVIQSNARQTKMLRDLPAGLHGFIAMDTFLHIISRICWLEVFLDRNSELMQELCMAFEIKTANQNSLLFSGCIDGLYYIEKGVVAIEGTVYLSGDIFGRTILRESPKVSEARALTDTKCYILPKADILRILAKHPKILYYAKRWTQWSLVRTYIKTYTQLYYRAARRGALMDPPLLSNRPNLAEDEMDDIDVAVQEHILEFGY